MLQKLREKTTGWIAIIILGLLAIPFAFFGIEHYFSASIDNYAAKIESPPSWWKTAPRWWPVSLLWDTREISQPQFQRRFDQERQRMREIAGERFDAREFESAQNKRLVLDRLVDEELLRLAAARDGLTVSDAEMRKEIAAVPAFQRNGRFDPDQYRLALSGAGQTARGFEEGLRGDLLVRLLPAEIAATALVTDADVEALMRLMQQTRDVAVLDIPAPADAGAAPGEAEIKAWYDKHVARYRSEEQVALEYVELDAKTVPVAASVDEASLRQRYDEQKARFAGAEQRLASHILVKLEKDADAAGIQAAQKKAADLAVKAKAPGADFAAIARESSDDLGSKAAGGDLGWIEKGLGEPAFDQALYALKPDQVSDPVRTSEGFHLLKLRETRAGTQAPFEQVRAELEREYLQSERERAFSDVSGTLVDEVLKDPTALAPAARKLKIELKKTPLFGRDGGGGLAANPAVREAAFSEAQLQGNVSDPIEIGPDHLVLIRVAEHRPSKPLPLAQVRERIAGEILADRRATAAKKQADALLARAQKGEPLDALAKTVERGKVQTFAGVQRTATTPAPPLVEEAFGLPHPVAGKASHGIARVGNGYALVAVTKVTQGDTKALDASIRGALRQQLASMRGAIEQRAYLDALRRQYTVNVSEDKL